MKIGDYVKYENKLWEIVRIDSGKRKTFITDKYPNGLTDYYLLNCKSIDIPEQWVSANLTEETDISQLYFEL